jgi:CHAT domain-containing protein/tetratricopeptide (TPR) repeat protein
MPQPSRNCQPILRHAVVATLLIPWAMRAVATSASCSAVLGAATITQGPVSTHGTDTVSVRFDVVPGHPYLVAVEERGNDALIEVLDPAGDVVARADHPERRTGTRRVLVAGAGSASVTVRVTGKELATTTGTATVRAFDLASAADQSPACIGLMKTLAAADADYARGQEILSGRAAPASSSAHDAFVQSVDAYEAAERALLAPADAQLRGEAALALAGVEYFDLQNWAGAADWAREAAQLLGESDPYRRARAEALMAAAWIEIGSAASSGQAVPGLAVPPTDLLARARAVVQRLGRFHLQRGEVYDAALQFTNIVLIDQKENRYPECVADSSTPSRLFGSIGETLRRAQAWQNEALCLWGLGRLPEAQRLFERALADIPQQTYPHIFLASITNTALADYALGRFDESLRLYDRALRFARQQQAARDEAYCLYGIGVNYYALGDPASAQLWLEPALAIQSVALDGRGRMVTLRALATVEAEQRQLDRAIAYDREALALAIAPTSLALIRIQLAAHTGAAGHLSEARAQLDEILSARRRDPMVWGNALLQRAVLLRETGEPRAALVDLAAARPALHRLGSVADEFAANLELARTLRTLGRPHAALAAVATALRQSDALRLQTINPELRSQLQAPLRAAYDLKIELLRARYEAAAAAGHESEAQAIATDAFAAADASRAHSLADIAAQQYTPEVRRALAPDLRRREQLYRELAARSAALDLRLDYSGSNDPRARQLLADIAELERQVDTLNTRIAVRAAPASSSARVGSSPVSLPLIPADTALVAYWLGSDSAYAWVLLPHEIHWVRLPSPQAIAAQATAFHRSLVRLVDVLPEQRLQGGRALYEMVVRPIAAWLAGVRQWVIIPDGALDYVPFAALREQDAGSGAFVVSHHDIALAPAAWMLDANGAHSALPGSGRLLLVADPVYQPDDPRLKSLPPAVDPGTAAIDAAPQDYQRLQFAAEEAAGVLAQFPPTEVDQLVGLQATRAQLLALDWSRYRFIHIATHGRVDVRVPQLSALMLGSYDADGHFVDGAVRVADLAQQRLNADVAVFSACETALGREVPSEGLVGISSTVLARGARAVVASLWPVADEIGARLMTDFYRHLLRESMSAPAALGAAMRSVVSRDGSADPSLWAAFQVYTVALGPGLPSRNAATADVVTRPRP